MAEIEMCDIASCGAKAEVWGYIDVAIEALLIEESVSVCLCKNHAKQWQELGEFFPESEEVRCDKEEKLKPCGRKDCAASSNIFGSITYGRGYLDDNGFWSDPCETCTKAHAIRIILNT